MDGNIYAGGTFSYIGGVAASGVAEWNGSNWLALGSGVGDPVFPYVDAFALDGSNVYVGGPFTTAGGASANRIAMWDGAQWHALGGGLTGSTLTSAAEVNAISATNGLVYAGGAFLAAGGDPTIRYFAVWNGTNWSSLGPAMAFVNGQFRLTLTDQFGRSYGVQVSSDLVNWTRVTTFTNLGGYSEFIDTNGSNMSQRYFRIVIP